jgi:hypothetical protein
VVVSLSAVVCVSFWGWSVVDVCLWSCLCMSVVTRVYGCMRLWLSVCPWVSVCGWSVAVRVCGCVCLCSRSLRTSMRSCRMFVNTSTPASPTSPASWCPTPDSKWPPTPTSTADSKVNYVSITRS